MNKTQSRAIAFVLAVFSLGIEAGAVNTNRSHDFKAKGWSGGVSCAICHELKNGQPTRLPPGVQNLNLATLNPAQQAAVKNHPKNILCMTCHVTDAQGNSGHDSMGGIPAAGTLAPGQSPPPPSYGEGTQGAICVRVNNRGVAGSDCLQCHNIHNTKDNHLLKSDYGQPGSQ